MRWCERPTAPYFLALGESPLVPLPAGRRDGTHRRDGAAPSTASAAGGLTTPIRASHRAPSSGIVTTPGVDGQLRVPE